MESRNINNAVKFNTLEQGSHICREGTINKIEHSSSQMLCCDFNEGETKVDLIGSECIIKRARNICCNGIYCTAILIFNFKGATASVTSFVDECIFYIFFGALHI